MQPIILFVHWTSDLTIESIRTHLPEYAIYVLHSDPLEKPKAVDKYIRVDFSNENELQQTMAPFKDAVKAIVCRNESNLENFAKLIPLFPHLTLPTAESILAANDKELTRKAFSKLAPEITPQSMAITSKTSVAEILESMSFPLIVKPAHLDMSLLVTVVHNKEELAKSIQNIWTRVSDVYETKKRSIEPKVVVEEFIQGEMFTIAVDVDDEQNCYFYPVAKVVTGRDIGHADVYLHRRDLPQDQLSATETEEAHIAARKGILALGLKDTTTHVELLKTQNGWKVIEIGPRMGGFRENMYKFAYNIDYGLNDVRIKLGQEPIISHKIHGYISSYRFYAKKEEILINIQNIEKVESLDSFKSLKMKTEIGEMCMFSRNGGKGVFDLVLSNTDKSQFMQDKNWIEQNLKIETRPE